MNFFPRMYKPIIENWLTVKDLEFLDTACCNRAERVRYHQVLHSGVMMNQVIIQYQRINWLSKRNIRVDRLILQHDVYNSCRPRMRPPNYANPEMLEFFNHLTSLTLVDYDHEWIEFVLHLVCSSSSLKVLSVSFRDPVFPRKPVDFDKMHQICVCLPAGLQSLTLHQCNLHTRDVLLPLAVSGFALRSVSMRVCNQKDHDAVLRLLQLSGLNLAHLSLQYPCENDVVKIIAQYCINLTSLTLFGYNLSSEFGRDLRSCLQLTSLSVSSVESTDKFYFIASRCSLPVKLLTFPPSHEPIKVSVVAILLLTCPKITRLDVSRCNMTNTERVGKVEREAYTERIGPVVRDLKKNFDFVLAHVSELNLSYSWFNPEDAVYLITACSHLLVLNLSNCEWVRDDFIDRLAVNNNSTIESIDLTCCHGYNVLSILKLVKCRCPPPKSNSTVAKIRTTARLVGINVNSVTHRLQSVKLSTCCVSCQEKTLMKFFNDKLGPDGLVYVKWSQCELGFVKCTMCIN